MQASFQKFFVALQLEYLVSIIADIGYDGNDQVDGFMGIDKEVTSLDHMLIQYTQHLNSICALILKEYLVSLLVFDSRLPIYDSNSLGLLRLFKK